jgi:hypothetical protein
LPEELPLAVEILLCLGEADFIDAACAPSTIRLRRPGLRVSESKTLGLSDCRQMPVERRETLACGGILPGGVLHDGQIDEVANDAGRVPAERCRSSAAL